MTFNICAHIVSRILCRHFILCKVSSETKDFIHDDNLVLVSEFVVAVILSRVVAILSEWWPCRPLWAHPCPYFLTFCKIDPYTDSLFINFMYVRTYVYTYFKLVIYYKFKPNWPYIYISLMITCALYNYTSNY